MLVYLDLYMKYPAKYWDQFYRNNQANFFKDRKWLRVEFPALYEATLPDAGAKSILEVGCGAGNTLFPVLRGNKNPDLLVTGVDFSSTAVKIVKDGLTDLEQNGVPVENSEAKSKEASNSNDSNDNENDSNSNNENSNDSTTELSNTAPIEYRPLVGRGAASVWDLAEPNGVLPEGIEPGSVDIVVLIFVFSALSPDQWKQAVDNLALILKPGGIVLFRDYARYDLTQLRFKSGRMLDENFYIRGDGTRVYFFTEEELDQIFGQRLIVNKIATDRRLMVNRKRRIKMFRIWLQASFELSLN